MSKQNLWALGFKNYQEYLQSTLWEDKAELMKRITRKCEFCGKKKNLQVHHKHYRNVTNEQQKDLRVLCKKCHEKLHKQMENDPELKWREENDFN